MSCVPQHRTLQSGKALLSTGCALQLMMSVQCITCGSFSQERSAASSCAAVSAPDSSCAIWPSVSCQTKTATVSAPLCKQETPTPEKHQHCGKKAS